MKLENVRPNKVEIELGGKTLELRFPARAFAELQTLHGGWRAAWKKLVENYAGDIDYDVLADFLSIGTGEQKAKVKEWVMDLFQDEIADIITAINSASVRWLPEVKPDDADPTR